ncbi:MAG: hypothetical protein GY835_24225, partial [bacterium]|nr:hypothetical protein [bacterium]
MNKHKPTHWDVRPFVAIPLIQPRRDVVKELRPGGPVSGLTARRPIQNEVIEREQRDDRDRQQENEWNWQIQAGMAEQPIFLPNLQEPTPMMPMQLQRIV